MEEQVPRIKLKHLSIHMKYFSLNLKSFIISLCMLTTSISLVQASTCSGSVSNSTLTTTERCSFIGPYYPSTIVLSLAEGPVSKYLYYLYYVYTSTDNTIIRKVDASGSVSWMASFDFNPSEKSLAVDTTEQYVYVESWTSPLVVLRLSSSNGLAVSQHKFDGIDGESDNVIVWPCADSSGYFVNGYDSSSNAMICKYTFSTSSAQCQTVTNILKGYGYLMMSQFKFFLIGIDLSFNLHMYKITFSATSVDWAKKIISTGACSIDYSESLLSTDGSKIYSLFPYGISPRYLYFFTLAVSDGSVSNTRYKSTSSVSIVYCAALSGDYIVATTDYFLGVVIYKISTSVFTIKSFSGSLLYGCGVEPSSGRFFVFGSKDDHGYTIKFVPQSGNLNSDFSTVSWTMNAISAGTDELITENGVTIGAASSIVISVGTYSAQSLTYVLDHSYSMNADSQANPQSLSITEDNISTIVPSLPCSFIGTISIVYSLSSFNGANAPSFVSIDSATGVLSVAAPSVSSSTSYSFSIVSTISGVTDPVQNIINLKVNKCTASNCQKCLATDSTFCTNCSPGYNLNSGSCSLPETETAKILRIVCQSTIGIIAIFCIALRCVNLSSMSSLWSTINQTQIFFILLLTGAFIPKDIEGIITGMKILLNPFSYFQSICDGDSNFLSNIFNFGLRESNLDKLGIKSDSTIVNIYSFILSLVVLCFFHICVTLFQKICCKESKSNFCSSILNLIHFILKKIMIVLTFAMYIRMILITSQYILLSCIAEVYYLNHSETKRIISIVIAFLTLTGLIVLFVISVFYAFAKDFNKYYQSESKGNKFIHLFDGLSQNLKSRLFIVILLLRRTIFVALLITIKPISSIIVISILSGFQLVYICILIIIRPYEQVKCNIIEISNELFFTTVLASLIKFNCLTDWGVIPTTAYTWLITSNYLLSLLIILIDNTRIMIIKCKNKYCNRYTEPDQDNQAYPVVASRIINTVNEVDQSNVQTNKVAPRINVQFDPMGRGHRIGNRFYVKR